MIIANQAYDELSWKYRDKINELEKLGKIYNTGFNISNRIISMFEDEFGSNWNVEKDINDWDVIFVKTLGIVKQHIDEDAKFRGFPTGVMNK